METCSYLPKVSVHLPAAAWGRGRGVAMPAASFHSFPRKRQKKVLFLTPNKERGEDGRPRVAPFPSQLPCFAP